jgi:hypothetical protein
MSSSAGSQRKDLDGFHPGLIDFASANFLIPVTQMEPNKSDHLVILAGGGRLF